MPVTGSPLRGHWSKDRAGGKQVKSEGLAGIKERGGEKKRRAASHVAEPHGEGAFFNTQAAEAARPGGD